MPAFGPTLLSAGAMGAVAPDLWLMGLALLLSGFASSAFFLARQGFMIDVLPPSLLARSRRSRPCCTSSVGMRGSCSPRASG